MATYAIGDIQGCYDPLRRLLDRIGFDPGRDRLWFAGDLVNRGPQSLETLRFVRSLGKAAVCVLGNHDLHLLALSAGNLRHREDDQLLRLLDAPDAADLLLWLRQRPLLHHSASKGWSLIHAGLPPQWDLATARACAHEVERVLRGNAFPDFMGVLYGNQPDRWDPALHGIARLRFSVNCFTRLRFCTAGGRLVLKAKGPPGSQPPGVIPWFLVPGRRTRGERILFGHWSTLGFHHAERTWCLDTGCVWGGTLTAVRVRRRKPLQLSQWSCRQCAAK